MRSSTVLIPLALQLHSLRREMAGNPDSTLRRVPWLGFGGVELAGTYNWPAEKWRMLLAETNLKVVGAHIGHETLQDDWRSQTEFYRAIGCGRLVVPWLPEEFRSTEGYRRGATMLNELGRRARAEGFAFFYHNHAFEFERLADGTSGIEILLRETDPTLVSLEVDTHWVEHGGRRAHEFIAQHQDRIGMIHAKDFRRKDSADVLAGQGNVDFKSILTLARQNDWPVVVEYEGDNALPAVAASALYLSGL
jgi:sugar phosphate isomerase/epimerase